MFREVSESELLAMSAPDLANYKNELAKAVGRSGNEPRIMSRLFWVNDLHKSKVKAEAAAASEATALAGATKISDLHGKLQHAQSMAGVGTPLSVLLGECRR